MIESRRSTLLFAPTNQIVEAEVCSLTDELITERMQPRWWQDQALRDPLEPEPIDRHWNWHEFAIEHGGVLLPSERVALITGDGEVQGAMLMSTVPIDSLLESPGRALLVELLFTAPRNRPNLRRDQSQFFVGVGKILLAWASWFSRECGYQGRLRLDASPDFIGWYKNRGFDFVDESVEPFEGVQYTPMELPVAAAKMLIESAGMATKGA